MKQKQVLLEKFWEVGKLKASHAQKIIFHSIDMLFQYTVDFWDLGVFGIPFSLSNT